MTTAKNEPAKKLFLTFDDSWLKQKGRHSQLDETVDDFFWINVKANPSVEDDENAEIEDDNDHVEHVKSQERNKDPKYHKKSVREES